MNPYTNKIDTEILMFINEQGIHPFGNFITVIYD